MTIAVMPAKTDIPSAPFTGLCWMPLPGDDDWSLPSAGVRVFHLQPLGGLELRRLSAAGRRIGAIA